MHRNRTDQAPQAAGPDTHICWKELLLAAMSGLCPTDQQVEFMLDRVERAR